MKKNFLFLALSFLIALIVQGQNNPDHAISSNWQFVGNEGLSVGLAMYQSIAISPSGQPFIAFSDDGLSSKVSVLKFDGSNWIPVGPLGFSAGPASCTSLAFSPAGQPFLAFRDGALDEKATVMKYDGSAWVNVGIPGFTPGDAWDISLAFGPTGIPYVAFTDDSDSSKASVMKFDTAGWVYVGSPGFSARYANFTSLAFLPSGEPCVAYEDGSILAEVAVKKFDGVSWNYIGSSGFSHDAMYTSLAIAPSGEPYVAYNQNGDTLKGIVEKFDGINWVQVGPAPFNLGGGGWSKLVFSPAGQPYVSYVIENYQKANVSKFNGTNWTHVGNMDFSPGAAYYLGLAFNFSGHPFVVFQDHFDALKTSVMVYPDDSIVTLHISGIVTDSVSHLPIANHPVIIDNDTMNGSVYPHHRIVYTDVHGIYNDTILLPSSVIPWRLIVRTYDCNHNQYYFQTGYYSGPPVIQYDFSIYSCGNSSCQAGFVACRDSVSPLTFHFVDQSDGNITSWYWSFGDFTSSTERNPSHTYLHPGEVHHVCLMVKDSINSCCDVYCMDVVPGPSDCQANFYFYSDSTGTDHVVHFFDISTGNPTGWSWNFGDPPSGPNNVSSQQNPVHIFSSTGTYTVCLSITANGSSSSYCRDLVIPDSVYTHQLYGQVFAGAFPLQQGLAMIFSLDTNQSSVPFVEVSTIDSNGVYYFIQVPDGNYVINAIPKAPDGYLPTYFGDVITWEQATQITLGTANNPYTINLVPAGALVPGSGSASGQINTGKTSISLIDKITMTLLDINKNPISFSRVSSSGAFDFPSLDFGTYYLHPEITGITSELVMIEITPAKPHADVIMTFTGNSIIGINNLLKGINSCIVYPNPVNDNVNVSFKTSEPMLLSFEIINMTGDIVLRVQKHLETGSNSITLSTGSLDSGIYSLRISSNEGFNLTKKLVKLN